MFRGINAITIDIKGRLTLPMRYREAFNTENISVLVITIDIEETCLLMYPVSEWQLIENKLQNLPSFHAATRRIQRLLIGHATDVELDAAGRLLLPPLLREYAQLDKKIVLIGQGNKFEIWDELIWQNKRNVWLLEEASGSQDLPDELKTLSL